jgi:hypothetical protein
MVKRKKKEKSQFDKARHILKVISQAIEATDEATTNSKRHEHNNVAIIATESLWQELRYLSQNL